VAQQAFGEVRAAGVAGAETEDERLGGSHGKKRRGMTNDEFRMTKEVGMRE
jgi:hypothetical protein